jgi:hypothetical protein
LIPVILIGDLSRIIERPIPFLIWKLKLAKFKITNPEAVDWEMRSGVNWEYPFAGIEGFVNDFRSKAVGPNFWWFVFGYFEFYIAIGCQEEACRRFKFTDEDTEWFVNSIRLIPNKFPVKKLSSRGYDWKIGRSNGMISPLPRSPEDSLYSGGIRGRVEDGDLLIEGVNGGQLFVVNSAMCAHDADWGDGKLVPEIRISDYEKQENIFVVYFLRRNNNIFKGAIAGKVITKDTVTILSSAIDLGDGKLSTTPELAALPCQKYLRGYINGKPR